MRLVAAAGLLLALGTVLQLSEAAGTYMNVVAGDGLTSHQYELLTRGGKMKPIKSRKPCDGKLWDEHEVLLKKRHVRRDRDVFRSMRRTLRHLGGCITRANRRRTAFMAALSSDAIHYLIKHPYVLSVRTLTELEPSPAVTAWLHSGKYKPPTFTVTYNASDDAMGTRHVRHVIKTYKRRDREPVDPEPQDAELVEAALRTAVSKEFLNGETVWIPVRFVVFQTSSGQSAVTESRLKQQMTQLNNAYKGQGFGFELHSIKYVRNDKWYNDVGSDEDNFKKQHTLDPARILNIYTGKMNYLGYAYTPDSLSESHHMQGVVLSEESVYGGAAPYNLGMTAVHEVGHYFGLLHVFEGPSGQCNEQDLVADTVKQRELGGCSEDTHCGSKADIHNYMQYTDDKCMNSFTPGQNQRMRSQVATHKKTMATNNPSFCSNGKADTVTVTPDGYDCDGPCEAGVDCGGQCDNACPDAAPCANGEKDGQESDVDCGGNCPNKCKTGQSCNGNSDCGASLTCNSGTCGLAPQPVDCVFAYVKEGTCSKSCGGGQQTLKLHVMTQPANGGKACPTETTKTEQCNTQACDVDCVFKWEPEGQCSKECGGGEQQQRLSVVTPQSGQGKACPTTTTRTVQCNTAPCAVDCQFHYENSTCTQPCGGGSITRTLKIDTPASNGGKACPGTDGDSATQPCNTEPCGVDCKYHWATGSCNAACGGGQRVDKLVVDVTAQHGGKACPTEQTRTVTCNQDPCPVDCQFHYENSPCSKQCGGGSTTRTLKIDVPAAHDGQACPGVDGATATQECNTTPCPVDCNMSSWVDQGCDAKCGPGTRSFTRSITTQPAHGGTPCQATAKTEPCNLGDCPAECQLGDWSGGQCSKPCGGGTLTQTRTLSGHCPSEQSQHTITCNNEPCDKDCVLGNWTDVSASCSVPCGTGSKQQLQQIVAAPEGNGAACPSLQERTRTVSCKLKDCPVDCQYNWVDQGACSAECGGGSQSQQLNVTRQPAGGGKACPTQTSRTVPCNNKQCSVDCRYSYENEGTCSQSCGDGTQRQKLVIEVPAAGTGSPCPDQTSKLVPCNLKPCAEDCVLSDWSALQPCQAQQGQCGEGVATQVRQVVKLAQHGGKCNATSRQQPCLIPCDCVMGSWSNVGGCDGPCGSAKQKQTRGVVKAASHGGVCEQSTEQMIDCSKPCPGSTDGNTTGQTLPNFGSSVTGGCAQNTKTVNISCKDLFLYDGYVESDSTGLKGARYFDHSKHFTVGDTQDNTAYRGFVSCEVKTVPADMTVLEARLTLVRKEKIGNPSALGQVHLDLAPPRGFVDNVMTSGPSYYLFMQDYEAKAAVTNAEDATFGGPDGSAMQFSMGCPAKHTLTALLSSMERKLGANHAQFKVRLAGLTNNDGKDDQLQFWAGAAADAQRPLLQLLLGTNEQCACSRPR